MSSCCPRCSDARDVGVLAAPQLRGGVVQPLYDGHGAAVHEGRGGPLAAPGTQAKHREEPLHWFIVVIETKNASFGFFIGCKDLSECK